MSTCARSPPLPALKATTSSLPSTHPRHRPSCSPPSLPSFHPGGQRERMNALGFVLDSLGFGEMFSHRTTRAVESSESKHTDQQSETSTLTGSSRRSTTQSPPLIRRAAEMMMMMIRGGKKWRARDCARLSEGENVWKSARSAARGYIESAQSLLQ